VVIPSRARNPRPAPETSCKRTRRRDRRHRRLEGLRHHTPTTARSRKRRPRTHRRAKHQDAGRSGGAHQRQRTTRRALVALARISPRATRPRRRRRPRNARRPPDPRRHPHSRSADLPHRHRTQSAQCRHESRSSTTTPAGSCAHSIQEPCNRKENRYEQLRLLDRSVLSSRLTGRSGCGRSSLRLRRTSPARRHKPGRSHPVGNDDRKGRPHIRARHPGPPRQRCLHDPKRVELVDTVDRRRAGRPGDDHPARLRGGSKPRTRTQERAAKSRPLRAGAPPNARPARLDGQSDGVDANARGDVRDGHQTAGLGLRRLAGHRIPRGRRSRRADLAPVGNTLAGWRVCQPSSSNPIS